jgi:hypothetical protein
MTTASAPSFPAVRVKLFLLLFLALFVALLYTTLHFFDLGAHISLLGELTPAQRALQTAAGVSSPLLVWVLFIYVVPRRAGLAVELLKSVASMATLSTLLAWIILPFFHASGSAPSDDSINFLSVTALRLYAGGWALFLARIRGLRD